MQHKIYPSLYLLRLFAAMCVVLALFFCLSGFIIHIIYHDYSRSTSIINHWINFYVARLARIYPLYIFLLLIYIFTINNELFPLLSLKESILLFSSWFTMTQSWYYLPMALPGR